MKRYFSACKIMGACVGRYAVGTDLEKVSKFAKEHRLKVLEISETSYFSACINLRDENILN